MSTKSGDNGTTFEQARPLRASLELSAYLSTEGVDWKQFAEGAGLTVQENNKAHGWAAYAYVLSADPGNDVVYLAASMHPRLAEGDIHFTLHLMPIPNDNPPEPLKKSSLEVGGYDRFVKGLADAWPQALVLNWELEAHWVLNRAQIMPPKKRRKSLGSAMASQPSLVQGSESWSAPDGASSRIQRLRYDFPDKDGLWFLQVSAKLAFPVGESVLDTSERMLWEEAQNYLQ